jgi:type IV pilus assembly protein PilC
MLFSSRLPLSALIELCRVSRHYLSSGLSLPDVFRQQARRGPLPVRPVAERIASALTEGESLPDALKRESAAFPPLLLALADVGSETGMLPEVFEELEHYFQRQQQMRRQFVATITWPVIQFVMAVLVIAGLIFILGFLPATPMPNGKRYDPLGLGLSGPEGAAIFLAVVVGGLTMIAMTYYVLTRVLRQQVWVDRFLLAVPVLGPCLQALALYRFCLALRLTMETGMSIGKAMRLALRATNNEAFMARNAVAQDHLRNGDDLTLTLSSTGLFPSEFMHILSVGEESGRLSDVLQQQGDYQHGVASRRMALLTGMAGAGVWLMIGGIIVFFIFRLFLGYLSILDSVS